MNIPHPLIKIACLKINPGSCFLDFGCGLGKDSIFMAKKGFKVTAVDKNQKKIEKLKQTIFDKKLGNKIEVINQDIGDFIIEKDKYSLISLYNVLQFLPKRHSFKIIEQVKNRLLKHGIVVISAFTDNDPLFEKENKEIKTFFTHQELKKLFEDFKIIFYKEKRITEKGHIGYPEPHIHNVVRIIAQKIKS